MRILLTGSSGFIGSKLSKALEELGHEVLKIDRKAGVTIENAEFTDVDLVFHLAAQTDIQYSIQHPLEDAENNIIETIRLIQKYPVKVIYPASAASLPITSPYGLSKHVAGEYVKMLCADYVILTLPNIWGEGGKGVINKFLESDTIRINGDGSKTRTIVHVDDIVRGFIYAMNWPNGEYMLGGTVMSIKEIAEKISQKTGKEIVYNPEFKGEIYASVIPNTTPDWEARILL